MTEQPNPPPPSPPGWWARRSIAGKAGTVLGGLFVALLVIGLVAPPPEDDKMAVPKASAAKTTTDSEDGTSTTPDNEPVVKGEMAREGETAEPVEPVPAPDPVYTLRYTHLTATAGGALHVVGRTNLPDGTKLELTATRHFLNKGETEPRAARVATEQLEADSGAFAVDTAIDESEVATFADAQFPVATVSPNVYVCVTVRTGKDDDGRPRQPSRVSDVIGKDGKRLATSPLAQEWGGATDSPSTMLELAKAVAAEPGDLALLLREKQGEAPRVARLAAFCG